MSTLVIIDMQPEFTTASNPSVIAGVVHQIRLAKNRKAGIVIVEYNDSGDTLEPIVNAIGEYVRKTTVIKKGDDGSREVMRAIHRKGFDNSKVRLCGVNAGYCVRDTAVGLLEWQNSVIEVAKEACGFYDRGDDEWKRYPDDEPRLVFV